MPNNEFNREKAKLDEVKEKYKEMIEYINESIERLPRMYSNEPNQDVLQDLLNQYKSKLKSLNNLKNTPYFARIDFEDSSNNILEACYIGKVGVSDIDNNIITVDWRAPIASLYYDSSVGPASYVAPKGTVEGNLKLKRQFEIDDSGLKSYQDVDSVSNDELLKPYLGVNADSRLKNIVSTIQREQDEIIRKPININTIIQGVAGSGKTTVALHRIAYLVYNNQNNIKPSQYMVIGPNKFFLNYISSVLPDLDVENVQQLTYEELVKDYLDEDFFVNFSKDEILQKNNDINKNCQISNYKSSMKYKEAMDLFLNDFEKDIFPTKNLDCKGFTIIPQKIIYDTYFELNKSDYPTIESRVNRTILVISQYIKSNQEKILSKLMELAKEDQELWTTYFKNNESIKKELNNGCNQTLKKYFSKFMPKIIPLYSEFGMNMDKYIESSDFDIKYLKNIVQSSCKQKKFNFEDLAALMYLKTQIGDSDRFKNIKHAVIDEAQDYGDLHFFALKNCIRNSYFSVFGDLAQSIYSYRSIKDWNSVVKNTFNGNCNIEELSKSYRTTIEIMNTANNITDYIGLNSATPIIRHGDDVKFTQTEDICNCVLQKVKEYVKKGYKSIAIISKESDQSTMINDFLKNNAVDSNNIIGDEAYYNGGICTTTCSLAKGLEFDAVVLIDASENIFSSKNDNDMKLLYVAMTRPLHELDITYSSPITKPLQRCIK